MLTDIDLPSLEYICLNMRSIDAMEVYNMRSHDNAVLLAWEAYHLIRARGRGRIAWAGGKPVAIVAVYELWTGCWEVVMWGTDEFKAGAFECMRWVRRDTLPDLIKTLGGRRLQCFSHLDHHEAHSFLLALGASKEGPPIEGYGRDGSSYQLFGWVLNRNAVMQDDRMAETRRNDRVLWQQIEQLNTGTGGTGAV
jgi:hypothetical protein